MKKKLIKVIFLVWLLLLSSFTMWNNVSFALAPSSNTIYKGIDVSAYQGRIDYRLVKESGIDIVYIKASEGEHLIDPEFRNNYEGAKANGINVGFYHFVRARNEEQAIKEAEFFAKVISGTQPNCKLAMDFEVFGNLSIGEINNISKVFLERTQELTQKEMVIYSNTYDARTIFSHELASKYPLWVAQYGVSTPGNNGKWENWIGFQYWDRGEIAGINGNVDLDRFTEAIFLSTAGEIPNPNNPSPEELQNVIYYTVKRGDTLSKIASKYGTTVEEIVTLNNIQNPNLIYTGEVLQIRTSDKPNQEQPPKSNTTTHYVVKKGDNLWRIARRYGVTIDSIVQLNNIPNPNLIYPRASITN
ncbi:MAG: LysM peptidoglycan-binding domain-containing protein [Clostridia bacterium]|nr:LysM peptidoglycan-binding domain-containing protein [Clostridia bacterium]